MCGRFALTIPPEAVRSYFAFEERPNFPPRYNIAPTQPIGVVRVRDGARHFDLLRWGFIPGWVKDLKKLLLMINARSETVLEKPAFRNAFRRRRCLIPVDAFYEWQAIAGDNKRPFLIRRPDKNVFAFAGIWEHWMDAEGSEMESAAILTIGANDTLKPIHHRMPVVVAHEDFDTWLENDETNLGQAVDLLHPAPDNFFEAFEISDHLNKVKNDDASIQRPVLPGSAKENLSKSTSNLDQLDLF